MISPIVRIYAHLLDREYQRCLFGDLPGFQRKGNSYLACCPFHEDTLPTLVIYNDKPEYFCFVCSQKGDWLKYIRERSKCSFLASFSRLAEAAKIGPDFYDESEWKEELDRTALLEAAMSLFITNLWDGQGADVLQYLYKRGYSMGEVEGMALGSLTGLTQMNEYLSSLGFSQNKIDDTFIGLKEHENDVPLLVIPYRDSAGRLMGLMRRTVRQVQENAYSPLTGLPADTPFNMYRSRGQNEVIVVEGLFDALLLDQVRLMPVISVGKEGLSKAQIETAQAYGVRRFALALGNGSRRIKATHSAIELIREKGLAASVLPIPRRYEDMDQYIRKTCLDHFRALIKKSMSADQWIEKSNK
jgi:DNA primase